MAPSESQPPLTFHPGLGPLVSDVTVYGIALLLPLTIAFIAFLRWVRNRWRARVWRAALRDARTATEGDTVLQGTVELSAGASVAVRVQVTQQGTEKLSSQGWNHNWKEVERKVIRNPFYILEPSGRKVRVEPPKDVLLVHRLDQITALAFDRRIRASEVSAGKSIFAFGRLQGAQQSDTSRPFRDANSGPVLRAPRKGRMILASEPLHARFERNARGQLIWAIFLCVLVVALQLFALPCHVRQWFGETVPAEVVQKREFSTSDGQGASAHNVLTTRIGDHVEEYDVAQSEYDTVAVGDSIWIRRVPWWPSNQQLGPRATVHLAWEIVAFILNLLVVVAYLLIAWSNRPWWEGSVDERWAGPLPVVAPPAPK